jgi:hypothetical protein
MGTLMPAWKKKEREDSPCFLCKLFFNCHKRGMFLRSNIRIRFSHHIYLSYIHHIPLHMHILIWLYDLTLFRFIVWLYNIWITSMLCLCFLHSYELHISLSCKRERYNIINVSVRIHKYHIYREIWECHTIEALNFILKTCKTLE